MRNLFLIILTFIGLATNLASQNSSLLLGVGGGANLSKLSFTGDYAISGSTESRALGFQGGIDVGIKFNSFSFITGFKYQQRGGNLELKKNDVNDPFFLSDGTTDTGVYTQENTNAVISIPLLFRYQTKGDLAFSLTLGPIINRGTGDITGVEMYDFDNLQDIGPRESKSTYGDQPTNLLSKSKVGFYFSPGVLYKVSDNGYFRANFIVENGGNIVNPNHGISDNQGNGFNFSGSIKSSTIAFEIGYEHRIDFNLGSKY